MTTLLPTHSPAEIPAQTRCYNLIILGGGIVGLTLASALRTTGLRVAIIEAQTPTQAAARPRAYAFSPTSAEIFRDLGLWAQISPYITHFQRVRLSDGDFPVAVDFRPGTLGMEALYYAAEHGVLMAALQSSLQNCPTIDYLALAMLETVAYQPDGVHCTIAREAERWELTADLIIAADGARSRLRQESSIATFGWKYWQSCITCVLAPEHSHQDTAYERFWPSGPFAILPLPGNRCQIVWTAPHAEAEALLALPRDRFLAELQRRYGDQMGALTLLSEPLLFPVRLMQSDRYVKPRLALVGDAAHSCHPVGGQGLNMGIRDGAALAQVLAIAHRNGEDLGSLRVLRRYERWRRWENWLILSFTDILNRTFSNRWLPLVLLRRSGLWLMRSLPPLQWVALNIMTGRFGRRPRAIVPPLAQSP